MLNWLFQRLRPAQHEPEVKQARAEQKRKFDAWKSTMAEVNRVQKIAETHHTDMHKPR